jgi:putative flavoprotein involved in K+ transport
LLTVRTVLASRSATRKEPKVDIKVEIGGPSERVETVIVGGGQAGLAVGYHLARRGRPFVILDANERVGDAWRKRWDSLRLFTPARYDGLPGWRFPARGWTFPTKDEVGDYLEEYAKRFDMPVRTGVNVDGLSRVGDRFVITWGDRRLEADNVVIATGASSTPRVPAFARELDHRIVQLHSAEYRNPSQLQDGDLLVVGAGNSGAEISFELGPLHRTWLAGEGTGEIPVRHGSPQARVVLPVIRFVGHHVLTRGTPLGRKVAPKVIGHGTPLIRTKMRDLAGIGVERVPRVSGVRDGLPVLDDGRVLDVANVVWCTGFRPDFRWVDLPVFGGDGQPIHDRGIVRSEPGLYLVGQVFLYAATSEVLPGVGRDAKHIATQIAARAAATRVTARAG